jgi:putative ABC transport system permease protein
MGNILRNLRFNLRTLRKHPGFALVAIFTLALSIGANSAVFSVVNAILLRPLPYGDPERLVMLWEKNVQNGVEQFPASYPDYADFKEQSHSFQQLAAFRSEDFTLTGGGEPERIIGAAVTGDFFQMMGVPAALGRPLSAEDQQPGTNVVVVSHDLWQRRFGGNPGLVGQTMTLNEKSYTVVGVMPQSFRFPAELFEHADLWAPLDVAPEERSVRGQRALFLAGRLKPQVSQAEAEAEVGTVADRLQQQYQATNSGWGAKLVPLREQFVGDVRPSLLILLGAVSFVLLIACVNVANLLLARAASRQREIAIRMSIGASRWQVIQQLLSESLLLGLLGGALGLLLAVAGVGLLRNLIPASYLNAQDITVDGKVLAFTLLISASTAIIFGLVPAFQATKVDINSWLKEGSGKTTSGVRRRWLRSFLVVSEITISLVLFVGASLLIKSFLRLQQVDPGFRPDNVLTLNIALPESRYPDEARQKAFYQQVLQRLAAAPGVKSAGAVTILPLSGSDRTRAFGIEGRPLVSSNIPTASYSAVSADYFATLGIPLVKGRYFTERDTEQSPPVAVINETLARRYFHGEEALGKRLMQKKAGKPILREIVGVVKDVKSYGLEAETQPGLFVPYQQEASLAMTLVARSNSDPLALTSAARGAVQDVDPSQPIDNISTMEQVVSKSIAPQRLNMVLFSIFAAVALILAAVGIYSVMANYVRERRQELSIRLALGAPPRHVFRLVLGRSMALTLAGIVIGVAVAFTLSRLISSLLYGVSAVDPVVFVGTPLLLAAVAFLASYLPARQATKVDPMVALRAE